MESITERLSLYTRLDNCETENDLELMKNELIDRFGAIPPQVNDLFITVQCRWLAIHLGFEKLVLKNDILRCYFINRPDSPYFESATFQHILSFIQTETNKARLKQTGKMFLITVEPVKKMQELYAFLNKAYKFAFAENKALA